MKADDVILFANVAELGSFKLAAEKYDLAYSVVSKRIRRLEEDLNVQLLHRTTRKLSLTEAGVSLLPTAKQMALLTQDAVQSVSTIRETMKGHLQVSVPTISGDLLLAECIADFCHQHPGLNIDVTLSNRFVDLIDEGFDLAIRTGYLEDSSLIARHLIDSQWIVCASPTYLERCGQPSSPDALVDHNCLHYTYQSTGAADWEFFSDDEMDNTVSQPAYKGQVKEKRIVRVSGNFSTNNAAALRKAALAGYGIVYVPRCLVYHDLLNSDLIDIFPSLVAKRLGIYAIYPFTRHPSNKVKMLIEHVRDKYQSMSHYFL
ncbi:LysR family transcriptional regulator [Enterovibrio norvegicus]|uniref:LysR family transcriptional regulator n=1 Tax=Enterovibrio norvegicus TaxID=188144 RepID=A0A2N7L4F4_9GAMM|nr:LysR family transcriptional regulator [Enterovibrio norvegicus]PMN65569.1 LysR family transcriptional regulator [Enterovibrio norvegicus]PMN88260.1 LysR family transcriptional regulator [Enterovibrio norvegicus]